MRFFSNFDVYNYLAKLTAGTKDIYCFLFKELYDGRIFARVICLLFLSTLARELLAIGPVDLLSQRESLVTVKFFDPQISIIFDIFFFLSENVRDIDFYTCGV